MTAWVDAIRLRHQLSMDNDMEVSGRVVWTGKSSLDIQMELKQARASIGHQRVVRSFSSCPKKMFAAQYHGEGVHEEWVGSACCIRRAQSQICSRRCLDISQRHNTHSSGVMRNCTQALYGDEASLVALFTFVARDPVTQRALAINPLLPGSAADTALFAQRQHIADERRAARQAAVQNAGIRGGGNANPAIKGFVGLTQQE